ncbi:hypothetical protein [Streptomyces sp. KL116D]|uniref:hypothetical protein n=1 Tax=Streptomyces sp. KL116D TaxID=3045152 RepID=UPI0035579852
MFYGRLHPRLTAFVRALPDGRGRAVFATSGPPELPLMPLPAGGPAPSQARYEVTESPFSCRGFDTCARFKGRRRVSARRPGDADLAAARAFAERL